jgi:hypothetical protein
MYKLSTEFVVDVGIFGHKMYTSIVKDLDTLRFLSKKTAEPVSFYVEKTPLVNPETLSEILRGYFLGLTNTVITVELITYDDVILFYPVFNDEYLYASKNELFFERDLNAFIGRCFLSHSWLAILREKIHPTFSDVQTQSLDLVHEHGLVTYDESMNIYIGGEELGIRTVELMHSVEWEIEQGIVHYPLKSEESKVLVELSELFEIPRRIEPSGIFVFGSNRVPFEKDYHVVQNNMKDYVKKLQSYSQLGEKKFSLGFSFNLWIRESVMRLLQGKVPLARFFLHKREAKRSKQAMLITNPWLEAFEKDFTFVQTNSGSGFLYVPILTNKSLEERQERDGDHIKFWKSVVLDRLEVNSST